MPALVTFDTQTALTASGNSLTSGADLLNPASANGLTPAQYLSVNFVVTTASGTTPSLTVEVQWSNNGTDWSSVQGTPDTLAAITTTGNVVKLFQIKGRFARLKYTVTGTTPSFAFVATGFSS